MLDLSIFCITFAPRNSARATPLWFVQYRVTDHNKTVIFMKRQNKKACLAAMLLLPCMVWGQQKMSLDQLLQLADEQSVSIKSYAAAVESARHNEASAKAARLPDVGVTASVGYLGDGLLGDRDFSSRQHISNPHFMNNFALKAQQVIYSGGAIENQIAIANLNTQMARLDYARNRQEIRFLIASHYLDLCRIQNRQAVVEKNIVLAKTVLDNTKARHRQGAALKTDITRYELQLEALRLQLTKLKASHSIISHQLANMLHLDHFTIMATDLDTLKSHYISEEGKEWQMAAAENNANLQMARLAVKVNEKKVRLEKSALLPKVSIVAEEHFDGPITIEVPVIDKNFNYWFAGIGVSYNLSALYKGNKRIRQSKATLNQSREQLAEATEHTTDAILSTFTDYETALSELATQKKSVQLACERYKVTENRYSNGLALLTDMLDASNSKLEAELSLVDADINIIYNYFKLKYISCSL